MNLAESVALWLLISTTYEARSEVANRQAGRATCTLSGGGGSGKKFWLPASFAGSMVRSGTGRPNELR